MMADWIERPDGSQKQEVSGFLQHQWRPFGAEQITRATKQKLHITRLGIGMWYAEWFKFGQLQSAKHFRLEDMIKELQEAI